MSDISKTVAEELEAIRDREIQVRAAIAAQEHPEMLSAIIDVAFKLEEVKRARTRLKQLTRPLEGTNEQIERINSQIALYEHKVAQLKQQREQLVGENAESKKFARISQAFERKRGSLESVVKSWKPLFREKGLAVTEVFPEIEDYL
jgi:phage shock protein A